MNLTLNKPEDIIDLLNFYKDSDRLDTGIQRVIGSIQVPEDDLESFFAYRSQLKTQSSEQYSESETQNYEAEDTDQAESLNDDYEFTNSTKQPFRGIWSDREDRRLANLIKQGMSLHSIARALNRTDNAILARGRSEHNHRYLKNEQKWETIKPQG